MTRPNLIEKGVPYNQVIPPLLIEGLPTLSGAELMVYDIIRDHQVPARAVSDAKTSFKQSKTFRLIRILLDKAITKKKAGDPALPIP